MAQRIKGQECEIIMIADSKPLDTITTIKNFEFSFLLEILSEGYMGETTERKDSIFKGISGKLDLHIENQSILTFAQLVVDKARRREAGVQVNIKSTLNFPNGQRPRIVIPSVEFGEMPFGFGGRSEYLNVTLNYAAAEAQVIARGR